MNVPKACMEILCLVVMFGQLYANIDSKEYFCGKKLVRTLTELCSIYNNPTFVRNRFRRQIVDECCRSQCSRRYLVQYYCLEANSSIVKLLNATPENHSKTAHDKHNNKAPSDYRAPSTAEEKNSLTVGSPQEETTNKTALLQNTEPLTSNHNRISHGRRNCRCRKRRAKKSKKTRRLQSVRNMIHQNPVPPANIGQVEHSQKPFYVWRFSRTY